MVFLGSRVCFDLSLTLDCSFIWDSVSQIYFLKLVWTLLVLLQWFWGLRTILYNKILLWVTEINAYNLSSLFFFPFLVICNQIQVLHLPLLDFYSLLHLWKDCSIVSIHAHEILERICNVIVINYDLFFRYPLESVFLRVFGTRKLLFLYLILKMDYPHVTG